MSTEIIEFLFQFRFTNSYSAIVSTEMEATIKSALIFEGEQLIFQDPVEIAGDKTFMDAI